MLILISDDFILTCLGNDTIRLLCVIRLQSWIILELCRMVRHKNKLIYEQTQPKVGEGIMKKMMLSMLIVGSFVFNAAAQVTTTPTGTTEEIVVASEELENPTSAIQFGFWFDVPGYTKRNDVHGFRWGLPFSGTSNVKGFDWSLFGSHIESLEGLQLSAGYCGSQKESYGAQISLGVCLSHESLDGVQIALFNKGVIHRGWQCGVVNVDEQVRGVQHGIVNVIDSLKGYHAGIVNIVLGRSIGPQIGLFNYAERSDFQFGLININKSSVMPVMIFVNFSN